MTTLRTARLAVRKKKAMSKLKNGKKRKGKDATPPNFNQPGFQATSADRSIAKKKVSSKLDRAGITGADKLNAMSRGKLTQDASGNYTFSTDAYSNAE